MAKRFVDTNKYKKPFLRGLKGAYKLFWDYLCLDCDHAGIWIVDFEIAQLYIGNDMPINYDEAIQEFNKDEIRIIPFENDKKWFIPSFIEFQYGELKSDNRAHNSVIQILKKYGLLTKDNKPLVSPLQGCKDMDKDKDMDMDMDKVKDKDKELEKSFLIFWELYDKKTSYGKCLTKWKNLTNKDRNLILQNVEEYVKSTPNKLYRKNPETYLNNKSWNDEIIVINNKEISNGINKPNNSGVQIRTTSDIKRTITTDDIDEGIRNLYKNGL